MDTSIIHDISLKTVLDTTITLTVRRIHDKIDQEQTLGQSDLLIAANSLYKKTRNKTLLIASLMVFINTLSLLLFLLEPSFLSMLLLFIVFSSSIIAILLEGRYFIIIKNTISTMNQAAVLSKNLISSLKSKLDYVKTHLYVHESQHLSELLFKTKYASEQMTQYVDALVDTSAQLTQLIDATTTYQQHFDHSYTTACENLKKIQQQKDHAIDVTTHYLPKQIELRDITLNHYHDMGGDDALDELNKASQLAKVRHEEAIQACLQLQQELTNQLNENELSASVLKQDIENKHLYIKKQHHTLLDLQTQLKKEHAVLEQKISNSDTSSALQSLLKKRLSLEEKKIIRNDELDAPISLQFTQQLEKIDSKILKETAELQTQRQNHLTALASLNHALSDANYQESIWLVERVELNKQIDQLNKELATLHVAETALLEQKNILLNDLKLKEEAAIASTSYYSTSIQPFLETQKQLLDLNDEIATLELLFGDIKVYSKEIKQLDKDILNYTLTLTSLNEKLNEYQLELASHTSYIDTLKAPYL